MDAKFQVRRDKLQNYTKLEDDFTGRICYKQKDGLQECVENLPKWPIHGLDTKDPCITVLGLAQNHMDPITAESIPEVENLEKQSANQTTSTLSFNDAICGGPEMQVLTFMFAHEFEFGLVLGVLAYVFYIVVGQRLVSQFQRLHTYVFDDHTLGTDLSTSFKEPEITLQLVPPHYLDSTLV